MTNTVRNILLILGLVFIGELIIDSTPFLIAGDAVYKILIEATESGMAILIGQMLPKAFIYIAFGALSSKLVISNARKFWALNYGLSVMLYNVVVLRVVYFDDSINIVNRAPYYIEWVAPVIFGLIGGLLFAYYSQRPGPNQAINPTQ